MPIKEGPGGGAVVIPQNILYTSVRDHTIADHGDETQDTLKHIDDLITYRGPRLEAIKFLRVMLLSIGSSPDRNDINLLAQRFFEVYRNPRLSSVATAIGVYEPAAFISHFDLDWFGGPRENWWRKDGSGNGPDGRDFEKKAAAKLLEMLEKSMEIDVSSTKPETWKWHGNAPKQPTWKQDLTGQVANGDLTIHPIRLEWEIKSNVSTLTPDLSQKAGVWVLRFITPPPMDINGIQLA